MPRRRSLIAFALRQLLLVGLLVLLALAALVASGRVELPYRWDPFAAPDLMAEPDWLSGIRLARLRSDAAICFRSLEGAGVAHSRLPDRPEPEACALVDTVALPATATAISGRVVVTCRTAATLLLFERQVLQPAARAHLGQDVARFEHMGTHVCRRIAGSQRWSQHATANAIDVSGFVLADGRRITLLRNWAGDGDEAAFLRAVRDGACGLFSGVLGPDYNAAHRDHFHFDNGPFRICR